MNDNDEYRIRQVGLDQDTSCIFPIWKKRNAEFKNNTIHCDPEWLLELFRGEKASVHVFLLERKGEIIGVTPFMFNRIPLKCQFGGVTVGTFPLRRFHLLGDCPSIPEEMTVYDALFTQILGLAHGFDAIYMESVRVDSFLWTYLHNSDLVKKSFYFYCVRGPLSRPFIRLSGSFDDYMQKFSPKTRKNRLREVKRLQEQCVVQLVRVVEPEEVDAFVDVAAEISRKTYQYKLLGLGLRNSSLFKRRLRFAAERRWLRSYLLKCDGVACCFIIGYQYNDTFYYANVGYDPSWSKFSVGTVLLVLAVQDLFEQERPEIIDFGAAGGEYKHYFSNDSYLEADVFLFPRRVYPLLTGILHCACQVTSRKTGVLLDRCHLKLKVKRLMQVCVGRRR